MGKRAGTAKDAAGYTAAKKDCDEAQARLRIVIPSKSVLIVTVGATSERRPNISVSGQAAP
jgi:hypothetical protein